MKQKLKRAAMKMFQGALTRSFERWALTWAEHVEEEMEMRVRKSNLLEQCSIF